MELGLRGRGGHLKAGIYNHQFVPITGIWKMKSCYPCFSPCVCVGGGGGGAVVTNEWCIIFVKMVLILIFDHFFGEMIIYNTSTRTH